MLQLNEDQGWNDELIPGGTPRGYKAIKERLLDLKLVAYSSRNTYVYLSASNSWSVFVSAEAQVQICGIVGSENASVNYLGACVPYINYLQSNAVRATSIPTSVNFGTRRLEIYFDKEQSTIHLRNCKDIVETAERIDERIGGFCVMPCMVYKIPEMWQPGGSDRIYKYLCPLFSNSEDLVTLKWIIANSIVDPSSTSKFLILYGPGGTGKSTVISIIEDVLKGCCGTIKSSVLTSPRLDSKTESETAKAIASSRMLTAGDINLETNKLNLHTVKELTGHDSIAVPPIKVATSCSVIAACNDLPHVKIQPSWATTAISRRTVVLFMNVKSTLLPKRAVPDEVEDILDFLMSCIHTFISTPCMPISITNLLYSVLGSGYNEVKDSIKITESATLQDIVDASMELELYFALPLHTLGELASLICPLRVEMHGAINFIKNIKLTRPLSSTE